VILFSQVVYQDLTNSGIYEFLDELANQKIISLHSQVKPYSRSMIAGKLNEAFNKTDQLDKRQRKELEFYLKDYRIDLSSDLSYLQREKCILKKEHLGIPWNPLAFLYKDSLFTFSARPIWGIKFWINNNGNAYHRWGGAETFGTIGNHFGFYASLRDNHENEIMVEPAYFTQDEGAVWKNTSNGGDYSEMRGGVTFAWNWGSVALTKDHFQWGDDYHGSNILSGRTPSFPYLELRMAPPGWFGYSYVAGWLNSDVIDSSQSYNITNDTRNIYFLKFLSAAMLTFTPWKGLDLSAGTSVISCSKYFNPAFLSPFLFFVNFSYSGDSVQQAQYGQNSQLFFSLGSRQIRHVHLYTTLFFDGWRSGKGWHNYGFNGFSTKAGCKVSNLPFRDFSFTGEYTWSNQNVYLCNVATLRYESNEYGLGHYLGNNSRELFLEAVYKPIRGLHFNVSYLLGRHGADQVNGKLEDILWKSQVLTAGVNYEFISNANVFVQYQYSDTRGDTKNTPELFMGITNNLVTGFNIGF
jgi:hypothetical protein